MTAAVQPLFVYGAGRMGREVAGACRTRGVEPAAFLDRAADTLTMVDGIRVLAPDAPAVAGGDSRVIVALHSPGAGVADVVDELRARAFPQVDTLWTECARSGWLPRLPYWIDPAFDWASDAPAIAQARACLVDESSRDIFDQQVALRRFGDYRGLARPTPHDQYVPHDLPRWREPMRMVDCGAFDGDTVRAIRAAGYALEAVIAIEPDPRNFERLAANHGAEANVEMVEAGAHATDGHLSFAADADGAARVDAAGDTTIRCVRIDTLCRDFHPTLLKMDIEGGEPDALDGATATLNRDRPDLAISAYHRLEHLWRLVLQIDRLQLGYRFHLRSHAHNGFDTVLYARVA